MYDTRSKCNYHIQVIPDTKTLTPPEQTQNVKPNPFVLPTSWTDPFKNLVSKEAQKKADEMREHLRAEAKRVADAANEQTDSAKAVLASLGLPASLESIQVESGLPDSVWNRIAEIQNNGGVQELKVIIIFISYMLFFHKNKTILIHSETSEKLEREERIFNEIKQKIGPNWGVAPSSLLNTKYREDLKKITEFLTDAANSNSKLEKQIEEGTESFRDLEKTREVLSKELPKPSDEQKENVSVDKLKGLLDELSACIAQRDEFKQEYANQAENMDASNLHIQDSRKLLGAITKANEEFVKSKGSDPSQINRENFIHGLNQSCEKYNKIKSALKDGLKFYSDLMQDYITVLQTTVNDYVLARESERDINLAELNTNVAKLGIDAYGNLASSNSSSSELQSQPKYQPQSQPQSQSQQSQSSQSQLSQPQSSQLQSTSITIFSQPKCAFLQCDCTTI
ncbi:hypothetical protein RFI_03398 [Reticulomyxa filosa]|uniref:ALIX V-shaped domain-containing protein n=1 Tax=Reticulomyxa filosa TaxID=46433 RepID=X6P579_RETFI|nr:hypothetical protein RFI_03398 [Reticulomyxa filosa]|eukprot:ETO33705.1 hypothetical protein RFI_03398 [Reticulomyxa filosa]